MVDSSSYWPSRFYRPRNVPFGTFELSRSFTVRVTRRNCVVVPDSLKDVAQSFHVMKVVGYFQTVMARFFYPYLEVRKYNDLLFNLFEMKGP